MESASPLPRATPTLAWPRWIDWNAISTWLLGFGLVAYLGLEGGGYDPLVHGEVGIALWWIVLAGVLVGALPRRRPGRLAWAALGLFAAFVAWTALGLTWTESADKTAADLARSAAYLGAFALAIFARGSQGARRMVAAVGCAIAFVSIIALLSRLHPTWLPDAEQTGRLLEGTRSRLSYPLNYWNGLAALVAVGLPLMLHLANGAKSIALRALAAATLPAMALVTFLTLSRGGTVAAVFGLGVYLCLTGDRLPKLLTLLTAGGGAGVLMVAITQRPALEQALLTSSARSQGDEVLAMVLVVCAGVGLVQAGISLAFTERRPAWTVVQPRQARTLVVGASIAALLAFAALDGPDRASNAWSEFKLPHGSPEENSARLGTITGNGRYQYWQSAAEENSSNPLNGTGAATFEYWWARNGSLSGFVQDAHSLFMQTLGEQGVVGLALLATALLVVLVGGLWRILQASRRHRSQLAAALAGCAAFCAAAAVDWTWQLPAVAVTPFLLGAVLVTAGDGSRRAAAPGLPLPARGAVALASVAAIVAISVPLSSTVLVRESQAAAQRGDLATALRDARSARSVQPGAAGPRIQEALVLERLGQLAAATDAARGATQREATNWENWLILSRIESRRGRADAALSAFRRARSLNPRSALFAQ